MSRCFPFPPPGYVLNGIGDEALIESIKRAEEKAKKEQRRKERKSEKKDKKKNKDNKDKKNNKEKKDKKRKEREGGEGESEKHSRKRRRKEEVAINGKLKESCLEKSSLTVERDLLQSTSQNSCDSTLNSDELLPKQQKEKKQLHNNNNNNNDSESIIRIRLPIRRQNDPEVVMMTTTKDQQRPCPSREIKLDTVKSVTREQTQQHPFSTSKPHEEKRKDHIVTTKLGKEKKLSSTSDDPSSALCRFCPPSLAVQFLNVVENWVPNTIESRVELTNSEDDECWWFLKKPSSHKFDGTERCKQLYRNKETKQVISSSMAWPCARLLPEADVHALPYTVPF